MKRDAATERQVEAADPIASTWLSANAGSGKTRVLTDRVARLLLDGVNPLHILCLTYTKAAASEMQNRLFSRLGSWAMMPDDDLAQNLATLGAETPDLDHARTLFARAIETPGGLRIQTIHSFCAGLLRRFPLEAQISPGFQEMEDQRAAQLRAEIIDQMSLETPQAVAKLAPFITDEGLHRLLQTIAGARSHFSDTPSQDTLRQTFGLPPSFDTTSLVSNTFSPSDPDLLARVIALCDAGTVSEQKLANALGRATSPFDLVTIEELEKPLLFGEKAKAPYGPKIDALMVAATRKAHPELTQDLNDLATRIAKARPLRLALQALERTQALYTFAVPFTARYAQTKLDRGLLDFDDLIGKTRELLNNPAVAQWVLFRLDGGIDHILVDEAQDTSPAQWDVIRSLAQEFSAGIGAQSDRPRTIFVVGDKKQSIYSFQGADPAGFDQMRSHFDAGLAGAGQHLNKLNLEFSFRSSDVILRAVDQVFRGAHVDFDWDDTHHRAFKSDMPGRVDIWPAIGNTKEDEPDFDWTAPVDTISSQNINVRLANMIACEIKRMIAQETIPVEVGHTGTYNHRPITEGDVLILVQRRSDLFTEIIRACKQEGLNIAGADRLKVGAELAVQDITSLLRFLALAEDDLSLAEALRSPLLGWTERDLYALAQPRPDKSTLWEALRKAETLHPKTMKILNDLRRNADFLRPYDLINRLLTRHDGRRNLLSRLGTEAEDGIDAMLSQALNYESAAIPSLTGFIEWMQSGEMDIKRQLDNAGDRIRVMTVHGAKGLEAPIVFLPDTAKRRAPSTSQLLKSGDMVLWSTRKDDMPPVMADLREAGIAAQENERRRLLYVAMTRAESWLITCAAGDTGTGNDSWHSMIVAGLDHTGQVDAIFPSGGGKRLQSSEWQPGDTLPKPSAATPCVSASKQYPPLDGHPLAQDILTPSGLGGAKIMPGDTDDGDGDAARARGSLLHLLLEHLPTVPINDRYALAQRLAQASEAAGLPDTQSLISDTLALITAPHLSEIFCDTALTEAEVTAEIAPLGRLHGAIDRLIVTDTTVTAIDYKSNRVTPATPQDIPNGLLRQMGAYHAMLRQIWPDKQINTAILWTATATLMPLPEPLVTAALAGVNLP